MEITRPKSAQPIPEHAKKVFSGKLFDVYQWEQKLYDGSVAIFEKLKRADTVVVLPILPDGQILLIKEEQPGKDSFIGAPGGRVDDGEDILAAAKRELLEETGYEAAEYVLWHAHHPTSKIDWVIYTFIAKGLTKVGDLQLDGGEKIELMPVSFDELLEVGIEQPFFEKDIVARLFEARLDPRKNEELRKLFGI